MNQKIHTVQMQMTDEQLRAVLADPSRPRPTVVSTTGPVPVGTRLMDPVHGHRTARTPFGETRNEAILEWYDGPRALLIEGGDGLIYMGFWSDETDDRDRWIYMALSAREVRRVLCRETTIPQLMDRPLVVVETLWSGEITEVVLTDTSGIPANARPLAGTTLTGAPPDWLDAVGLD